MKEPPSSFDRACDMFVTMALDAHRADKAIDIVELVQDVYLRACGLARIAGRPLEIAQSERVCSMVTALPPEKRFAIWSRLAIMLVSCGVPFTHRREGSRSPEEMIANLAGSDLVQSTIEEILLAYRKRGDHGSFFRAAKFLTREVERGEITELLEKGKDQ